jgi:hypothetical protein
LTPQRKPFGTALAGVLLILCIVLLAANLWRLNQPPRPDPRMVALAVRATIYAVPTATPRIVEVTRVVQVTAPPPTLTLTLTPTLTPTPPAAAPISAAQPQDPPPADAAASAKVLGEEAPPALMAASAGAAAGEALGTAAGEALGTAPGEAPGAALGEAPGAAPGQAPGDASGETSGEEAPVAAEGEPGAADEVQQVDAPLAAAPPSAECPTASGSQYTTVPVAGGGLSHPDLQHADLNLALRGYTPTSVAADLFDKDGPVDGDPPQLAGIFADGRRPGFGQAYRVNDWDWGCGERGCGSGPLEHVAATLITLGASAGEPLGIPHRGAQIYGGGYKALVLYAEPSRITLGYTREDSVANGYAVHLEGICVDPNLLALYRSSNAAGRGALPALREEEVLGTALGGGVLVAIRDRGVFFDPRSRLDWWHGF